MIPEMVSVSCITWQKFFLYCFFFQCLAEFRAYFEKYGKVLSAEVMFNRETHKSRGFGFIVFESEDGADRVCAVKEHIISGKVVSIRFLCCIIYLKWVN